MNIVNNLENIKLKMAPYSAKLVIVTKNQPIHSVRQVYELGYRDFGENKVQNLLQKKELLPSDVRWHLIGHLQTNKVRAVVEDITLIHSVDSLKLIQKIDQAAKGCSRVVDVLLQVNISSQSARYGFSYEALEALLASRMLSSLSHVRVLGLMGMGSCTHEAALINSEFCKLSQFLEHCKQKYFANQPCFKELSIGMSGDFMLALKNKSTMVRLGSVVFNA